MRILRMLMIHEDLGIPWDFRILRVLRILRSSEDFEDSEVLRIQDF
jgi:hypothetical protein